MEKWLACKITPGQLGGEFGVKGQLANGEEFSLFVDQEDLQFEHPPAEDRAVDGWLRVRVSDKRGDKLVVALPKQTFANGRFITVKGSQLR